MLNKNASVAVRAHNPMFLDTLSSLSFYGFDIIDVLMSLLALSIILTMYARSVRGVVNV
jgi:hypothetical protein